MARPRKAPQGEILIATDSGIWTAPDGTEYPYHAGITRVRAGHALVRAIPEAFKPIDVHYDVEQMTAGPGELREESEVRG